ncbi:hypothetical protein JCM10207_000211 [Rhodosporidiobolus poonsookiae]
MSNPYQPISADQHVHEFNMRMLGHGSIKHVTRLHRGAQMRIANWLQPPQLHRLISEVGPSPVLGTQRRPVVCLWALAPENHAKPNIPISARTIRAENRSGEEHPTITAARERILARSHFEGWDEKDAAQLVIVTTFFHKGPSGSDPHERMNAIFFEVINGKLFVQEWEDANGHVKGPTVVVHLYKDENLQYDGGDRENGPHLRPSRLIHVTPEQAEHAMGAKWFYEEEAHAVLWRDIMNGWHAVLPKGEVKGYTLKQLADMAETKYEEHKQR